MSNYFFSPLGDNSPLHSSYTTYYGHGTGNLDYGIAAGTPVYAMCDGEIVYKGDGATIYTKGPNTYCVLKCEADKNNLKETFYIRYLHGDYTVHTGQIVQKGEQIGTIGDHGNSTGPHLHIDFTWAQPPSEGPADAPRDPPVAGMLLEEDGRNYLVCHNKKFLIDDSVDMEQVKTWQQTNGGSTIGYCWIVFGRDSEYKEPIGPEGGIPINKNVYNNNQGVPGHDNSYSVNAYFNAVFTEDFIGPPPNTWDDFLNNWNLRCLVSFVRHETGSLIHNNYWLYASAVTAKMMRATVLCHRGVNEGWQASQNTHNFKEWILKGAGTATWLKDKYGNYLYDNFGTGTEHEWRAWIGSQYINAGKYLVTEDPSGNNNILNNNDLPWIQAVYNNFRYPDIYGNSLELNIDSNFKKVIEDFANGLVTDNYYQNGTYGYPIEDMAFKAEYHDNNSVFVGYRHKSASDGITGDYNTYAYTLP